MSKSKNEDQLDHAAGDQHPATEPLVGDRPIESPDEDLLERKGLVAAICRTVERAPRTAS
jgi:hypothetical protein